MSTRKPWTREEVVEKFGGGGKTLAVFLPGENLRNIDLSGLDLPASVFADAIVIGANFSGAGLQVANFEGAKLAGAKFDKANLDSANLERAVLHNAILRGASLNLSKLQGADLFQADLREAQLIGAHLEKTNLSRADLRRAQLYDARLQGAILSETKLQGAHILLPDIASVSLERVAWGNYILGEEQEGDFVTAQMVYKMLEDWYYQHGLNDIGGEFFYRRMEAARKAHWQEAREGFKEIWKSLRSILTGKKAAGERDESTERVPSRHRP